MKINRNGFSITELLGAMAIIVATAMASISITIQVMKTVKKSKVVSVGIGLESAFMEAVTSQNTKAFTPAVATSLRTATALGSIVLHSNFGTTGTDMASTVPFYTLNLDTATPMELCFNERGLVDAGGCAGTKWVLKLQASYKLISNVVGNLPQYSIAYFISGNPTVPAFRAFGKMDMATGTFQVDDYFFPIPQGVYSGKQSNYSVKFGTCGVDANHILSLFSLDLQSGATACVVKGNECGNGEIATNLQIANFATTSPNVQLDMTCKPVGKCSCKGIEPKNWEVTSFKPSTLIDPSGSTCGDCKFAFRDGSAAYPVPAKAFTKSAARTVFSEGVCPSRFYDIDVTSVVCSVTNSEFVPAPGERGPIVTHGNCGLPTSPVPCQDDVYECDSLPSGPGPVQIPVVTGGSGGVVNCTVAAVPGGTCGRWEYDVVGVASGKCLAAGDKGSTKNALIK